MRSRFAALDFFRRIDVLRLPDWLRHAPAALVHRKRWSDLPFAALTALSPAEKALLRQYLEKNTRTLYMPSFDGAAMSLEHAEVISIYREPELAGSGVVFSLGIHSWAWERLCRHPELLGTALTPPPVAPASPA